MTKRKFLNVYQEEIDTVIKGSVPDPILNNKERELWVANDEYLYTLARSLGVRI